MLEEGIVILVNAGLGGTPNGGFENQLPENFSTYPTWTYRNISRVPNTTLTTFTGLQMARLQIDCYGSSTALGADCAALAKLISAILNGYQGTLADPDATFVSSCFRSDLITYFDPAARTYRRMIEFEILFSQD